MRKNGFTLIEFMVVMVLIGILGILGGNAYFESLKKGRDAKRIEDMQLIQKGFELYYSRNTRYDSCAIMGDSDIFPANLPTDPTIPYTYTIPGGGACDGSTQTYCVCAQLSSQQYAANYANSGANCDFAAANKQYYCVRNIQ